MRQQRKIPGAVKERNTTAPKRMNFDNETPPSYARANSSSFESDAANGATGVFLPEAVNGAQFLKYLRDCLGVDIAGGQDHLQGKVMRISHIGCVGPFDVITAVSAIEMALRRFGQKVNLGCGVSAAETVLMEG